MVERAQPVGVARTRPGCASSWSAGWDELLELDQRHAWHPYGEMPAAQPPLPVVSASGVRLRLADDRELLDAMSSWWCAIHGYRQPAIDAAVRAQLERMPHVMFGGLTHEPAIRLARRLATLTGLDHVFFADSGSVSVEVAIKLSLQYWRTEERRGRRRLLTLRGGYHGDTFGAMAVCDPAGMHGAFDGCLTRHVFADRPPDGFGTPLDSDWAEHVSALVKRHAHELAGILVEPLVQGAGGMRFHSPSCLKLLRELCDRHDLLLLVDEIATGFGRTGKLFACEHADVRPDVMCVGKALTGGYLTLAATLCTSRVAQGLHGPLMHGPTFMANPLATAAGLASTGLLLDGRWRADVGRIERGLKAGLEPARALGQVIDVRVLGAIGVIELARPVALQQVTSAAVDRGVWLRPFRNLIYAMPPYVCNDDDLAQITDAMVAAAALSPGE
jgi:adenosylmethionine-8-amino-7-oxononanoate aminotransferase